MFRKRTASTYRLYREFQQSSYRKAIVKYAEEQSISLNSSLKITEFAGYGIKAVTNGKEVYVGNARLLSNTASLFPMKSAT